jgi:hypothetical protein
VDVQACVLLGVHLYTKTGHLAADKSDELAVHHTVATMVKGRRSDSFLFYFFNMDIRGFTEFPKFYRANHMNGMRRLGDNRSDGNRTGVQLDAQSC